MPSPAVAGAPVAERLPTGDGSAAGGGPARALASSVGHRADLGYFVLRR